MKVTYRKHFRKSAEGHIHLDKPGACTISLMGAAAMTQEELNFYGRIMAKALAEVDLSRVKRFKPKNFNK